MSVVLGVGEAPEHPHLAARGVYETIGGIVQPAAAPRFERTPGRARPADRDVTAALERWGVPAAAQQHAREAGALELSPQRG